MGMSQVGGTNAIWTVCASLETVCCPIHYSMAHVNSGGAVNRQ
jgi:hypothetical protein